MGEIATREKQVGKMMSAMDVSEAVMLQLPDILASMTDDELVDWYEKVRKVEVVRWRVLCSVLAEAKMRIDKTIGRGKRKEAMLEISKRFGIAGNYAWEKVKIWNTFWQDPDVDDHVQPNNNHWVFQDLVNGISWYRVAVSAEDPIAAIEMAQEKYEAAKADPDPDHTYTVHQFKREIKAAEKPEKDRLKDISRQIQRATEAVTQLSAEDDVSHEFVEDFAEHMSRMKDTFDLLQQGGQPPVIIDEPKYEVLASYDDDAPTLDSLIRLMEAVKTVSEGLLGEGLDDDRLVTAVHRVDRGMPKLLNGVMEAMSS